MILFRQAKRLPVLGECAGVVIGFGSSSTNVSIGDRVCTIGGTPYASHVRVNGDFVFKIPHYMSYTTAASVPLAFLTAHHTLFRVAHL